MEIQKNLKQKIEKIAELGNQVSQHMIDDLQEAVMLDKAIAKAFYRLDNPRYKVGDKVICMGRVIGVFGNGYPPWYRVEWKEGLTSAVPETSILEEL